MSVHPPRPRYTLRDLPLAAKLVVSVFLVAVGLGYFSALVQLHLAHSDQKGSPLPTPDDVVKRFSYFEEYHEGTAPVSHVEQLVSGHREDGWGASNMTPAFFTKSSGYEPYSRLKPSDPKRKAVDDAREGERKAVITFIHLEPKEREAAYKANEMKFPDGLKSQPITGAYVLGDPAGGPPKSQVEKLLSGSRDGDFNNTNMTPAFFGQSKGYDKVAKLPPADPKRKKTDDCREGERQAFLAFIHLPADQQAKVYEDDAMDLPVGLKDQPITEDYLDGNGRVKVQSIISDRCGRCHDKQQTPNFPDFAALQPLITPPPPREPAIKVRSIISDRCGRCHNENQAPQFPTYDTLEPFITPPAVEEPRVALGKKWVGSSRTIGTSKLVESTHAHALSFGVLFGLTGFVFAFTSYRGLVRGVLAPVVLLAQVADVSCWWLARLDLPFGPAFAMAIMATGGVVGLGLILQITLSLFDLYGWKGRAVLLLLGGGVLAALGAVYALSIQPGLREELKRATPPVEEKQQAPPPVQQPAPPNGGGRKVVG